MAGNKKTRKPGKSRVHSFKTKGALPILFRTPAEDEIVLKTMPHSELAEMREGRGTEEGYWCVTNRINWASTLASMIEFSFDPSSAINAALDALMVLRARAKEIGKYAFKGEELRLVGEALTLADDMQDATTRRQHRDALVRLMQQMPADKAA